MEATIFCPVFDYEFTVFGTVTPSCTSYTQEIWGHDTTIHEADDHVHVEEILNHNGIPVSSRLFRFLEPIATKKLLQDYFQ